MRINPFSRRGFNKAVGAVSAISLVAACSFFDNDVYRLDRIKTCKGQEITVGDLESQLKAAGYRDDLDRDHVGRELMAYNNAACGGIVWTCKGETRWFILDEELHNANYDGQYNHSQVEVAAYNRAACPERGL